MSNEYDAGIGALANEKVNEKQRNEHSLLGCLVDTLLILLSPILLPLLVMSMPLIVIAMLALEIAGLRGNDPS